MQMMSKKIITIFTLKNFPNMDLCGKRYRNALIVSLEELSAFMKNKWVYSLMTYQKEIPLE